MEAIKLYLEYAVKKSSFLCRIYSREAVAHSTRTGLRSCLLLSLYLLYLGVADKRISLLISLPVRLC